MTTNQTSIQLSLSQQTVVTDRSPSIQVVACAGSGKTESVARRVAALLEEGVDGSEIVAFTFTEKAAAELKTRIVERTKDQLGSTGLGRIAQMYVGTIHGFCLRLIQNHVPRLADYDVLDENRHAAFVFRFKKEIGIESLKKGKWESVAAFIKAIDVLSNESISHKELRGHDFGEAVGRYESILDRCHVLTFSRIIGHAIEALQDSRVLASVAGRIKHLIVDEYQDINPSQDRLIRLLGSKGASVCVVGDDDQAIYQWRGSDVKFMQSFGMNSSTTKRVVLDENRRSVPSIVGASSRFAETITTRLAKKILASREAPKAQGIIGFKTEYADDEARATAANILALHASGVAFRDMAVLFRSVATSTAPFVAEFKSQGIPFACGGRSGLFLHPEIAALYKLHLWLGNQTWRDPELRTEHDLTPESIAAEMIDAFDSNYPVASCIRLFNDWKEATESSRTDSDLILDVYNLLHRLGVDQWDLDSPAISARMGAIGKFTVVLSDFENVTRRGRYEQSESGERAFVGGMSRGPFYYQRLALYLKYYAHDAYGDFEGQESDHDAVQILTVHGAKGLEWSVVFLPSLQDRRFPASRSGQAVDWVLPDGLPGDDVRSRYAGSEDEERRLFYVAMTRARDLLYLSHFESTEKRASKRSRFLNDVFPSVLQDWEQPIIPYVPTRRTSHGTQKTQTSLSELLRFQDCGLRHKFQRVLGLQTQLASELVFGKAIHHVLRVIADATRETGKVPDVASIDRFLDEALYFPFANKSSEPLMRMKARSLIVKYFNNHRDDLERVWATERPFELFFEGGSLAGRADVILDREDGVCGSLAIVDYKSGTAGMNDENLKFQLRVYATAARAEGLEVRAAYIHDLSASQASRIPVDISETSCSETAAKIETLTRSLGEARFDASPSAEKCRRCEYIRVCSKRGCSPD